MTVARAGRSTSAPRTFQCLGLRPTHASGGMRPTRVRTLGGVGLLVSLLSFCAGCSSTPIGFSNDWEWCAAVRTRLAGAGVGWPVAAAELRQEQLSAIERTFRDLAPRARGDLGIAANGWLEGFLAAAPYLLTGDHDGFNADVAKPLRRQLHLANVTINNLCGWDKWKGLPDQ